MSKMKLLHGHEINAIFEDTGAMTKIKMTDLKSQEQNVVPVDPEWVATNKPEPGMVIAVYEDGFMVCMTRKVYEEGLQAIDPVLENNFTYHSPKPGQQEKYVALREKAKELAYLINELCPKSREQSVAMTNLETSIFWANASIARN